MKYPHHEKLNLENQKTVRKKNSKSTIVHSSLQINDDNDNLHEEDAKFESTIENPRSEIKINDDKPQEEKPISKITIGNPSQIAINDHENDEPQEENAE